MAQKTFADALKEARRKAGLSQAELARRAGLTGSYISVLESRRRPPPSPRAVRALCRELGISPRALLEAAALERSPRTVRQRMERMRRERGRVRRSRDRLLTTTLFHLAKRPRVVDPMAAFLDLPPGQQALLGRLLGRFRRVRDLREAEAKAPEMLDEARDADRDALVRVLPRALASEGTPAAAAEARRPEGARRVPVHADLRRRDDAEGHRLVEAEAWAPELFFWRVTGDEAHPRIEAGDLLLLDPRLAPREGDLVALRHEGRDRVGLFRRHRREIRLAFPRPEIPPLRLGADGFRPAGVVIRMVRELR